MGTVLGLLARYANDTFRIVQSPYTWEQKIRLWIRLTSLASGFRGGNILGYKISCFTGQTLYFLYREIFARQCYFFEAETSTPFILDCGANIGMAVLYFKWLYPGSEVLAFEPEPTSFSALQENVRRNGLAGVSVHNVALWDADGDLDLFVPGNSPGSLITSVNPARTSGTPVKVRCARLSSFIDREVDFLKIDVEGAELQIIQDLAESGKIGLIRQMVIEYHHNIPNEPAAMSRLLRVLDESGFRYQISATCFPVTAHDQFQDILIGAFRPPTKQ
jgi:FkbM family methyltransferase